MRLRLVLLSFVCFFSLVTTNAQQNRHDYIIGQDGDTVIVTIKRDLLGNHEYNSPEHKSFTQIKPAEIKEYHFGKSDLTFRAMQLPDRPGMTFVKLLDRGRIDLYELRVIKYRTTQLEYYAVKASQPVVGILNQKHVFENNEQGKQVFMDFIADNNMVLSAFNAHKKHSLKEIEHLVYCYNANAIP